MRIWFNKTFSTINAVFNNLRQSLPTGEVTIICTHTHLTATAFLAADEYYLEPEGLSSQDYLLWCLNFCKSHHVELFWPAKESILISRQQHLFNNAGIQVLSVAKHNTLRLLNNKAHFYRELPKKIAQCMDFVAVSNAEEFDRAIVELSEHHPTLCVKPAVSVYGLGFRILDTQKDSITQLLEGTEYEIPINELRLGMNNVPQFATLLVMEHLGGAEWSVDCVGQYGRLLCAVQRKKSEIPGHGQLIDNNKDINEMVSRLTDYYQLNGIFNIQFKEGLHGVRLLEINPRPSGGFGMACLSGVNLAHIAWQSIIKSNITVPSIRYGTKVSEINQPVVLCESLLPPA